MRRSILSVTAQLSSTSIKPHAKITLLGKDRTAVATALALSTRGDVGEVIVYDQSYHRQMKSSFDDVARLCAAPLPSIAFDLILLTDRLVGHPSIVLLLFNFSPNAVFLIATLSRHSNDPSLAVRSLLGNRCRAGQVCGLGLTVCDYRLRYILSELLDVSSKNITGFTLDEQTKFIEPYGPSVTINGQAIYPDGNNDLSASNNASTLEEPLITSAIPKTAATQKLLQNRLGRNHTPLRVHRWLQSLPTPSKNKRDASNNAIDLHQGHSKLFQKRLTTWYCSQFVFHRTYDYTLGMCLAKTSRAFLSHSHEMHVLSTDLQHSSNGQFLRLPVLVRRYGVYALLRFRS